MDRYTFREYADMHLVYGFCNCNSRAAVREYQSRFPNRRCPDRRTFERIHRNLSESGTYILPVGAPREMPIDEGSQQQILELLENTPGLSIREISRSTGISNTQVWRVLRWNNLHAFHYQRVQGLQEGDYERRMTFCRWILENQSRLNHVLWTDEACFSRDGVINYHNLHYWAVENPHVARAASHQQRFSINLWAGILNGILIGPVIFPSRLNASSYLDHLSNHLFELLEDIPLQWRRQIIFQHDGASAHFGRTVVNWLEENSCGRWIGRNGPILWPKRSPDLTPLDYYLWGYMKSIVYEEEITSIEHLSSRINLATNRIKSELNPRMIKRSVIRRARLCLRARGKNFEQFM